MPLDVGETINNFGNLFLKIPIIHTVTKNPIYTSLIITFIIVLIIIFTFRDADTDEPILTMGLRSGFWIFIMMIGILFLHNKILLQEVNAHDVMGEYENIFNNGYSGKFESNSALAESIVPVQINTNFEDL